MLNIGKELKNRRKELDKTLEEINEQTKITIEHLKFLERNDFAFLPATYVKSFIGNYAKALDLDGETLVQEFDRSQEEEKRGEEEKEEEIQIAAQQSPVKQRALEWVLGVGSFALLVSLILVYMEFKSQIHAQPLDISTYFRNRQELAEIVVHKQESAENGAPASSLELAITAKERIWLQVIIDDQPSSEVILFPGQNNRWSAGTQLEIIVGRWTSAQILHADSSGHASGQEDIHLRITKESISTTSQ